MIKEKIRRTRGSRKKSKPRKISHVRKPDGMDLGEWQTELRRQAGRETRLVVRNLGDDPVFSEFSVTNPETKRTYRVVVRGESPGVNFCSCPDYAVNTLGTCKHIEATLNRLRRRRPAVLRKGYCPPFAEVYVRYGTRQVVKFSPGADCPASLVKLARRYFEEDGTIKPSAYARIQRFISDSAALDHELRIYDDAMALMAKVRDGMARHERLKERYATQKAAATWKKLSRIPLYPYQKEGAVFAAQAGRAIIADDMGLGKTIQAIAAAEMLSRECGLERVLVVCPASLKSQWAQEIEKFTSRQSLVIQGLTHQRKALYQQDGAFFKIVNYDVIHRDLDAIEDWAPELVILDEAQRIKNWQTRTAKTVKQIESPFAIVLTGTPLENRLEELHSIVEFVDRYRLGPLFAFKAVHEVLDEDSNRVVGYRDLNKITETLKPILIRRTKKEVLQQLPPRLDKNFFVPMTEQQWVPHDENREIVARIVAKWRRYHFLSEEDQLRLRIALQNMRMSCDSTYLIDHETRHHTKLDELAQLLEEIFEEPGAKVVIFSQWVRMNELVAEMLDERGWGHVHLHGGVPSPKRKDLVRALREDPDCRVFLSTDAGGVGLNLQAASTVMNMDLPWNPAVLEQRIGRVHRIGQRQPVRVVNFISELTIEQGMLSLLKFKKGMFAGVLDGATDRVMMGDSALGRFMKTVDVASSSIPADGRDERKAVEREEAAEVAADDQPKPAAAPSDGKVESTTTLPSGPPQHEALGALLSQGAELLQSLAQTLSSGSTQNARKTTGQPSNRPMIDTSAGRRELRVPLPDDHTIQQWTGVVAGLLSAFQRGR
jgi:superfamily II DNA or RNA helicase